MHLLLTSSGGRSRTRGGAALLLSLLILLVLVAIVIQITVGTGTDARVGRNDVGLTTMDLAVESAMLQVEDQLKLDAEGGGGAASGAAGAVAGAAGAVPGASGSLASGSGGAAPAEGEQPPATDSRRDEWARPQRTTINEIRLRILVQDEDSKINVLNMLNPDEKIAKAAFDRVVRCLDLCRAGTEADIDPSQAEAMAREMLEYMTERKTSKVPRPTLLSDDPEDEDRGLPTSLKAFAVLPSFDESLFRDFRDSDGRIVHSIGSFLTVWSSVATLDEVRKAGTSASAPPTSASGGFGSSGASGSGSGSGSGTGFGNPGGTSTATSGGGKGSSSGGGGTSGGTGSTGGTAAGSGGTGGGSTGGGTQGTGAAGAGSSRLETGGYAVNVNTAPVAVLKALFDDRDLDPRFWDRVVEYRNLEEEKDIDEATTDAEPLLDEFGEEIIERRIFDTLGELSEVDGYGELPGEIQNQLNQLLTTQSNVFSVFVIARRSTSAEGDASEAFGSAEDLESREEAGDSLLRVVRGVFWRHATETEAEIVPIVRWEVLDYVPYEVQDYPDEDR